MGESASKEHGLEDKSDAWEIVKRDSKVEKVWEINLKIEKLECLGMEMEKKYEKRKYW